MPKLFITINIIYHCSVVSDLSYFVYFLANVILYSFNLNVSSRLAKENDAMKTLNNQLTSDIERLLTQKEVSCTILH